jgi:hypothetical protein
MKRMVRLLGWGVILFPLLVQAQDQGSEVAREKQQRLESVINRILSDAPNLKLSENRAIVYARVGAVVWNSDRKQARGLFQNAVNELLAAQDAAQSSTKNKVYLYDLLNQSVRPQILSVIAGRDAEFALESFYRSRPEIVQKALEGQGTKPTKFSSLGYNSDYLVQSERNLEQALIRMAAEQNPERAAKLLREALEKGISDETLNLLKRLNDKDPDAASEIAAKFVGKLIDGGFTTDEKPDYRKTNLAINILSDAIRERSASEKSLKLDTSLQHSLAEKLVSYAVADRGRQHVSLFSILPIAEKLVPTAVSRIKDLTKNGPERDWGYGYDPELNKLMSTNPSAEELMAAAKRFPDNSRRQIYQSAAAKFAQSGDISSAMAVVNDNFADDALEEAVRNLNAQYSGNLMGEGKYAEAERLIDDFPESTQLQSYINLANVVFSADREKNKTYALQVLAKARNTLPDRPEKMNDLSGMTQLISAYSAIEPSEAFRTFEALVPQLNELADAAAVINAFQGNTNVKQGEFSLMQGNNFGFYLDTSSLPSLASQNFDRTMKLIDSFARREIQTMLRLQLAEGGLN